MPERLSFRQSWRRGTRDNINPTSRELFDRDGYLPVTAMRPPAKCPSLPPENGVDTSTTEAPGAHYKSFPAPPAVVRPLHIADASARAPNLQTQIFGAHSSMESRTCKATPIMRPEPRLQFETRYDKGIRMMSRPYGAPAGWLAIALAIGATAPAYATNGYFSDGYGIKNEGLAGAGIAFPQDSLTIATNPAGLTVPEPSFDVGLDIFLPRRSATIDQGGGSTRFDGNDAAGSRFRALATATASIRAGGRRGAFWQRWAEHQLRHQSVRKIRRSGLRRRQSAAGIPVTGDCLRDCTGAVRWASPPTSPGSASRRKASDYSPVSRAIRRP